MIRVGLRADRDVELVEQAANALFDLVADRADRVDALAGGVGQFPVHVTLSGVEGAGVATAHGDDDVGGLDDLVGPGLGVLPVMSMPTSAIAATRRG